MALQTGFSLDEKYHRTTGTIYLTGVQAVVRLVVDQVRADRARGLRTAGIVSGYPGSPLAGLDTEFARRSSLLREWDIVQIPGLNEDLAATAIFGSQLAQEVPGQRFDGVIGLWFGKAPGVDRSGDAFRHGNFKGIGRNGGIIAVAGDDPRPNSSTVPSDSTIAFYDHLMPTIVPADVQEVLDLGLHAYELSRTAGLAVGFPVITAVSDMSGTATVAPDRIVPVPVQVELDGEPFVPRLHVNESSTRFTDEERYVHGGRLELALAYARANQLNPVRGSSSSGSVGIVASGKTFLDVLQAMRRLGLDAEHPERHGLRLLKLGMTWPFDVEGARQFARGLDEIIVVENKRPRIETFLRDALYPLADRPVIVGKRDEQGGVLLPINNDVTPEHIARAITSRLSRRGGFADLADRLKASEVKPPARLAIAPTPARTPYFCSGCPHSRSLEVPEGSIVGAGIGCHIMATFMDREKFGDVVGYTHMGAEGAQWVGMAPFTETKHIFQNLGDGTFAHSGTLAIRFAIAAGATMTYKILHNGAVAMTGGQEVPGGFSVAGMVRLLQAEGVKKIVVTTEDLSRYKGVQLGSGVDVRHRDELVAVQEELSRIEGVTIMIHDQQCAAEARRRRKRDKQSQPQKAVWINERVCEGCGDCGDASNCLSVQPVETELGRKTQIHQSSCNADYSCLLGDCPSFMTVKRRQPTAALPQRVRSAPPDHPIPEPVPVVPAEDFSVLMSGVGGTGVVTVNQILGTAAVLDGRHVRTMDNMGGSQKAGPVVSHLRVATEPIERPAEIGNGEADGLLIFDLLVGADEKNLARARRGRTTAVISTAKVPTGRMITDPSQRFPDVDPMVRLVERAVRPDTKVVLDAVRIAEQLLHTHMAGNMVGVGAAYQAGLLPIPEKFILEAIRLNGTAVDLNIDAFRWGRLSVAHPDMVSAAIDSATRGVTRATSIVSIAPTEPSWCADDDLRALIARRADDLVSYQNARYANEYLCRVQRIAEAEQRADSNSTVVTRSVAEGLYKLMAYKDEYEVARLCLDASDAARRDEEFGAGAKAYWHLHPPVLRSLGMKRKLKLGPWFKPAFVGLRAMRRVRHTKLDLFGYSKVRRVERELARQYAEVVDGLATRLTAENLDAAAALAALPDMVRGYEHIKLNNVATYEVELERHAAPLDLRISRIC